MTAAWYPMVPYGVAVVALPIVTYLAQPSQCFWYLYAPIAVPVLCSLVLACAGVQHLSGMRPRAKLACAIVFGVGIQFTVVVPCFSGIDNSPDALRLALWSLLFGAAAAIAMLVVAASMFFARAASQALPLAIAGIGQSVSAVAVVWGVGFVYLGLLSNGPSRLASWLFVAASQVNHGAALLVGLALTGVGLGASLLRQRSQE